MTQPTLYRLNNLGLIISFLICYVDFGHDGAQFIGQMEFYAFINLDVLLSSFQSPICIIVVLGQFCITISTFKNIPNRILTLCGIGLLTMIVFLILIIGVFSKNLKMLISTVPFIAISTIYYLKPQKINVRDNDVIA